jgi:hypothetical protein
MGGAYRTRGGDGRCIEFRLEILKGRHLSKDLDKDRRVILKWILGIWGLRVWIGFIWLMTRICGASCRHCDEPSGFRKLGIS